MRRWQGQIFPVLLRPFWSRYPSLPPVEAMKAPLPLAEALTMRLTPAAELVMTSGTMMMRPQPYPKVQNRCLCGVIMGTAWSFNILRGRTITSHLFIGPLCAVYCDVICLASPENLSNISFIAYICCNISRLSPLQVMIPPKNWTSRTCSCAPWMPWR